MLRNLLLPVLLAAVTCTSVSVATPTHATNERELVVLLHGLGRSPRAMAPMAEYLEARGYEVHNIGYPSTEHDIRELTRFLGKELARCCPDDAALHFVTHSLGGVLVRAYLDAGQPRQLGRVVMLSPPNHGSELADWLQESWLSEIRAIPAIAELGTDPQSVPNRLGPARFELGIITGARSWHPFGSWLIEGESDGVVSVESARLEGSRDFLVVPHTHTFIMRAPAVAEQVLHFLRQGRFALASQPADRDTR